MQLIGRDYTYFVLFRRELFVPQRIGTQQYTKMVEI